MEGLGSATEEYHKFSTMQLVGQLLKSKMNCIYRPPSLQLTIHTVSYSVCEKGSRVAFIQEIVEVRVCNHISISQASTNTSSTGISIESISLAWISICWQRNHHQTVLQKLKGFLVFIIQFQICMLSCLIGSAISEKFGINRQ